MYIVNGFLFRRSAIRLRDGYIITIMMHAVRVHGVYIINTMKQGERTDLIDNVNKVGDASNQHK